MNKWVVIAIMLIMLFIMAVGYIILRREGYKVR